MRINMSKKTTQINLVLLLFTILLIIFFYLTNWPKFFQDNDKFPGAIVAQCHGKFNNCIIKADTVTDFEWDLIYIFEDSARNNQIQNILGFEYNNEKASYKRKIIFVKDKNVVHEEFSFFDPWDNTPNRNEYFNYQHGPHPYYIVSQRNEAFFKVELDEDSDYILSLSNNQR